ncbi:MAG: glycosyltransferase family 39 protein [Candidatus Aenigmarchaeota archaeon]|nr:glycosyltransferase family 39 protein [Candidatus Aenigmarchaeota archaeon]
MIKKTNKKVKKSQKKLVEDNVVQASKIDKFLSDKHNVTLIGILLLGAYIRFKYLFVNQALWMDAAVYLTKAQQLAFDLPEIGWTSWGSYRPMLFPYLASFLYKLGATETTFRFIEFIISFSTIILVYLFAKKLFNKNIALASAALFSSFYLHIFFTARILLDVPATFFVLLIYYLFWIGYFEEKTKYLYASGVALGLGYLTYNTVLFSVIPLGLIVLIKEKTKAFTNIKNYIAGLFFLLPLIPYMIYNYVKYGNPLEWFIAGQKIAGGAFSGYEIGIMPFVNYIPYSFLNIGIFILFLCSLIYLALYVHKFPERNNYFYLLFSSTTLFLSMIVLIKHFEPRYLMPLYPFFFIILALGIEYIGKNVFVYSNKNIGNSIMIILVCLTMYYQFSFADELIKSKHDSFKEIAEGGLWIKEHSEKGDVIFGKSGVMDVYYSERRNIGVSHNKTLFEENLKIYRPKYLTLSVFEGENPGWIMDYLQKHNESIVPVKYYTTQQDGQEVPILIIYEFKYPIKLTEPSDLPPLLADFNNI